ncbi:hypothetical protein [Natronospora cellulosivora (SeqCode)]
MKKKLTCLIVVVIFFLLMLQFLPTLRLRTRDMVKWETEHYIIYFNEDDRSGAEAVFAQLEKDVPRINEALQFIPSEKVEVYIYENQNVLHQKKYGFLVSLLNLDWYIGDNIRDKVIMVSPLNPGPVHSFDSVVEVVSHEYVHALIYQINKKVPLWLDEGLALFLTNGQALGSSRNTQIPTFKETQSNNSIRFANANGYGMAHIYIDFLTETYGFDSVLELVNNPKDHERIFGRSEKQLYDDWLEYLRRVYP